MIYRADVVVCNLISVGVYSFSGGSFPSFNIIGDSFDWSLLKDMQLGPGESGLS